MPKRPLLKTKFSVPQIPPEFVHRTRLTEQINRGVQGPLTLLAAPAGFGKTILLIEWTKETNLPVAWLTIDSDENDIGRFFSYLIVAMQSLEPQLGEEALNFIHSTKGNGVEVGLTLLINEIAALPKEMVLVLDDFQALEDSTILQNFDFLLKHLPHNLHIVIATRNEPALDLVFLRSKGWVVELGVDDLRFTSEEVALFFQQAMGLQFSKETVQMLEKRTEGWVTALQMIAVSMRDQDDPSVLLAGLEGDAHYLVDFLAEEVLDRQPEDIRQFLLRSSTLDTLTGSLCEAVVNPDAKPGYGTVMLNRLERANLFITALDEKHEWFRYHNLFVDFLRHIYAEINPSEIPVLQKRAALWFEKNANLEEAFRYGLATGDMKWTADLIERNIRTMIQTGEVFPLTYWIGKLPDRVIDQHPHLGLAYVWGLIASYQLDLAQYWINNVQRSLDQVEKQIEPVSRMDELENAQEGKDTGLWNIRGALAICQSTLALLNGDLEKAAKLSKKATNYLQEGNPFVNSLLALEDSLYFILSGDTQKAIDSLRNTINIARQANNLLVQIIATCQLAEMQVLQGQLNKAWATLRKAQVLATGPDGKPLPLAGLVDIEFGEIFLERDSLEEANEYLERGCQAAESLWSISSLDGLASMAHLRQALGDISGSQAVIAKAYNMVLSTESSQWDDVVVSSIAVRMALQRGDLTAAEKWWVKGGFPDITGSIALESYPYHIFEYLQLTQARFFLVKGQNTGNAHDLQRASDLLATLLIEAERFQRVTSQIEILVLQAIVLNALKDERAKNTLLRALALGEPEGFRRIYLGEGHRLSALLIQCQSAQQATGSHLPSREFIESLLEAISRTDDGLQVAQSTVVQGSDPVITGSEDAIPALLSDREMEVLRLIANGKSNKEIAAQLYIALNTVKRHAYNIYRKLEVSKRTHAVSKARKIGLIP